MVYLLVSSQFLVFEPNIFLVKVFFGYSGSPSYYDINILITADEIQPVGSSSPSEFYFIDSFF